MRVYRYYSSTTTDGTLSHIIVYARSSDTRNHFRAGIRQEQVHVLEPCFSFYHFFFIGLGSVWISPVRVADVYSTAIMFNGHISNTNGIKLKL